MHFDTISNTIHTTLKTALVLETLSVKSEDGHHFSIIAVGDCFAGKSRVQQQQMIYKPLMHFFAEKQIHAVTIKAFTSVEWQKVRRLHPMH